MKGIIEEVKHAAQVNTLIFKLLSPIYLYVTAVAAIDIGTQRMPANRKTTIAPWLGASVYPGPAYSLANIVYTKPRGMTRTTSAFLSLRSSSVVMSRQRGASARLGTVLQGAFPPSSAIPLMLEEFFRNGSPDSSAPLDLGPRPYP